MRPRWFRRNRWGLVALLPLIAGLLSFQVKDVYTRLWTEKPREPVPVGEGGWVAYSDARVRLISLAPATDVKGRSGDTVILPSSVIIWRARIAVEGADAEDALGGCDVTVEAGDGRIFSGSPTELDDTDAVSYGCLPPSTGYTKGSPYELATSFVLPRDATPVAVRIVLATQLPRYARLSPR